MNILYIGDIMATPGIAIIEQLLPGLRQAHKIDLVIAQSENVTNGKGMSRVDYELLKSAGVDFFTGGNHSPKLSELHGTLENNLLPVIGPANMPDCPGRGWKYVDSPQGKVLVISLLGKIVGKHADKLVDNPLLTIDKILEENQGVARAATVVNFHGDFSSEKVVIGYYLDGRVSAVIGDHWHIPTADARVLPKGTAHITDVGMCGSLESSLGVKFDTIVQRWRNGIVNRNELELDGAMQFNAVLIDVEPRTQLSRSIAPIRKTYDHASN